MEEKFLIENLDNIPVIFRDYLFNFVNILKKNLEDNLLSVLLFGSVARGKWTIESNVDLFVIVSNAYSGEIQLSQKIIDLIIEFEQRYNVKDSEGKDISHSIQVISLLLKELDIFRTIFYDIAVDGKLIYDRNQIGAKFIKKIKDRIEEKGLKRIFNSDNDFYWKRRNIKFGEIIEL